MNIEGKIMKIRYSAMKSENYRNKKAIRLKAMKNARGYRSINSSREYFAVANSIHGKKRIESRQRINRILAEKAGK